MPFFLLMKDLLFPHTVPHEEETYCSDKAYLLLLLARQLVPSSHGELHTDHSDCKVSYLQMTLGR